MDYGIRKFRKFTVKACGFLTGKVFEHHFKNFTAKTLAVHMSFLSPPWFLLLFLSSLRVRCVTGCQGQYSPIYFIEFSFERWIDQALQTYSQPKQVIRIPGVWFHFTICLCDSRYSSLGLSISIFTWWQWGRSVLSLIISRKLLAFWLGEVRMMDKAKRTWREAGA